MRKIDENIWVHETGFKLFGAEFGNRMTIIRLSNGKVLLHSPVKIEAELVSEISSIGEVSRIVTPNNFHGLFVDEWMDEFSEATLYSPEPKKNEGKRIELLGDELVVIKIEGAPKVNEYAFIHKSSNTLILTDIAFNISRDVNAWTKIFFMLNGALGTFGPTRLMKSMITDWDGLRSSMIKILEYEIDRVIVSHGDIVEEEAVDKLREVFIEFPETRSNSNANSKLSLSRCG